ncbi:MAG: UDP-N-acetylmuramate dehydrogenase [Ruminococcaceae bacterium]|nr:UDP-N-acetylmuramate dehydrogenase [Oscillospiraceae bacterium]
MTDLIAYLAKCRIPFVEHCPLAGYSTLRVGGRAALAVFPQTEAQLVEALTEISRRGLRWITVGKGSNLLFPDGEYSGVALFTQRIMDCCLEGRDFRVSAGALLGTVAIRARNSALTGAEFLGGIPGTVGGALVMNAGAFGSSMAAITVSSRYWDPDAGCVGELVAEEHCFGKRTSFYATRPRLTVLSALLRLEEGNLDEIDQRMKEYHRKRSDSQPLKQPNAGSIFKNPEGDFAGRLIEDCGLKGARIGGAEVSVQHANFIVNRGGATARDVVALIRFIRQKVYQTHGIVLECELRAAEGDLNEMTPIAR